MGSFNGALSLNAKWHVRAALKGGPIAVKRYGKTIYMLEHLGMSKYFVKSENL